MRSSLAIGAFLIGFAGTAAQAVVTHTYDFNDAALFQAVGPQGTFYTGGAGGGFYPRSGGGWPGQPGVTTAPESGAMRYTSTQTGFGGARLFVVEGDMTNYRNNVWTPEMDRANNPYVSVSVFNGAGIAGDITFYTLAVSTPSTNFGVGISGGTYRGITVKAGTGTVNAGGGTADVAMVGGWNSLAMQLTADGTLNYYLNSVNIRSVPNASGGGLQHNYLMDAWDSAAGFYSNGATSGLFDNFVVGNGMIIPAPGAFALVGIGGLLAARRRR